MIRQSYSELIKINSLDLQNKSVLIIGSGTIVNEYVIALVNLGIKDVTIIGNTENSIQKFKHFPNFKLIYGGYEINLPGIRKKDLTIIATPISSLTNAAKIAIENQQSRILIEKPGSVYKKDLKMLESIITNQKIRIGYNRLMYPSFHKLKSLAENDGGIISCKFDFTEWTHTIPFGRYKEEVYKRWGISNSLHVISMAFELIGMPEKISTYQNGKLEWHPSGSVFVGSGISENKIPFSYHANWNGGGRWGVEVVTQENIYRLIPLEKLYGLSKGSTEWKEIVVESAFPKVKEGIAEEIAVMLDDDFESKIGMISLQKAIKYNEIAEVIFGYKD
ncbi:MAG: hypothetical protein HOO66_04010 [Nitrosarchaeum sp.]|nr:hypothetical protein [Nitrosarchaeum sp.]